MDVNRLRLNESQPEYVWEANMDMAERVQEMVKNNVHEGTNLPYISHKFTRHTMRLPVRASLPTGFDKRRLDVLCDRHVQRELEDACVVNWCRSIKMLTSLRVPGDGNCLLHAVSVAIWGVPDSILTLRRLLYIALVEDVENDQIQYRWKAEKGWLNTNVPGGGLRMNSGEWNSEWNLVKCTANDSHNPSQPNVLAYESLEEIHIFVLANILCRPIIVLAEPVIRSMYGSTMAPNTCGGIYLPLLQPHKKCVKSPIVLGYESNHFAPFIGTEDYTNQYVTAKDVVPLVDNNLEPLHIHFLLGPQEEQQVATLLMNYLNLIEVNCVTPTGTQQILSACLQYLPIAPALDLMKEFCQVQSVSTTSTSVTAPMVLKNCTTPGCTYFGSPEFGGCCSGCFCKYTMKDVHSVVGSSHRFEATEATSPRRGRCKNGSCSQLGKTEYKGYCRTCFIKSPSTIGHQTLSHQSPSHQSPSHQSPSHQAPSHEAPSHQASSCQTPLASLNSFTRALSAIRVCIGPDCSSLARESCNGLCKHCYETLKYRNQCTAQQQRDARQYNPSALEPKHQSPIRHHACMRLREQSASPTTIQALDLTHQKYTVLPSAAQPVVRPGVNAKQCCVRNCDYFGDPSLDGYCSHCYPPYQTTDTKTTHRPNDMNPANTNAPFGFVSR